MQTLDQMAQLKATRLNKGRPLIQADPDGWDNRFTLNPTAHYLERSPKNDRLIVGLLGECNMRDPMLRDGVVAVYYRGIPKDRPGEPSCRSSVGLALFTPGLRLIKRFTHPVLSPADDPNGDDFNGVEDQRITRIGDTFYLIYCGFVKLPHGQYKVQVCMAESDDMLNWRKLGPVKGNVNRSPNKDAVLLPDPVGGQYIMFHRPCVGRQSDFSISLAVSDSPTGEWTDCGTVMRAIRHPRYTESWVGMGSTPIRIEDGIYLADYHTGNYLASGERDYFANYATLDFSKFDPRRPEAVVTCRCEGLVFPETRYEICSPWPHSRTLNCVFPCGSYEFNDDIYLIYGGADAYVLGAKMSKHDLLCHTESARQCRGLHTWSCPPLSDNSFITHADSYCR